MRSETKAFANANKHFIFVINIRLMNALNCKTNVDRP